MSAISCLEIATLGGSLGDRRVAALADEIRGGLDPPFDVDDCAARLRVPVRYRHLPGSFWGATLPTRQVVLNRGLSETTRRFALAHELGHVLVQDGRASWVRPRSEESFCDRLARHLLAPLELLGTADLRPAAAAAWLLVDEGLIWSQLSAAGVLPDAVSICGDLVICCRCGDLMRDPNCECASYRRTRHRQPS